MKVTIQETNTVLTVSEAAKVIASGNDTEVQFNDGGSLAGASFFTLDKDTSSATLSGNFVIGGNLQVDGTTTTINSTELTVDDLNIVVASGAADAAAANGAGITIDGANASLTYDASEDTLGVNKPFVVSSTWNDAGTIFEGLRVDVVDTASDASSMPFEINLNGTPIIQVDKTGTFVTGGVDLNAVGGNIIPVSDSTLDIGSDAVRWSAGYFDNLYAGGLGSQFGGLDIFSSWSRINLQNTALTLSSSVALRFSNNAGTAAFNSNPTQLRYGSEDGRIAINKQAGIVPGGLEVYSSYTDESNYDVLTLSTDGSSFFLESLKSGTGVVRDLFIRRGGISHLHLAENQLTLGTSSTEVVVDGNLMPSRGINLGASHSGQYNEITNSSGNITLRPGSSDAVWVKAYVTDNPAKFGWLGTGNIINAILEGNDGTSSGAGAGVTLKTTWNDASRTYTSFTINATDTASAAASKLLDLQVDGATKFEVDPLGNVQIPRGVSYSGSNNAGAGMPLVGVDSSNTRVFGDLFSNTGERVKIKSGITFGLNDKPVIFANAAFNNENLRVNGDASFQFDGNVFAVRNVTNAQTFELYGTYTDASNYERFSLGFDTSKWELRPQSAGAGATRFVKLSLSSDPSHNLFIEGGNSGYLLTLSTRYGTEMTTSNQGVSFSRGRITITGLYYGKVWQTNNPVQSTNLNVYGMRADPAGATGYWLIGNDAGLGTYPGVGTADGSGWHIYAGYGGYTNDPNSDGGDGGLITMNLNPGGTGQGTGANGSGGKFIVRDWNSGSPNDLFTVDYGGRAYVGNANGPLAQFAFAAESASFAEVIVPTSVTGGGSYIASLGRDNQAMKIWHGKEIGWAGNAVSGTPTVRLIGVADPALELRDGTNAQEFRIYGTYTDVSNYERLSVGYDAANTRYQLALEEAGTGSARPLTIVSSQTNNNDLVFSIENGLGNTAFQVDAVGDVGAPRAFFVGSTLVFGTDFGTTYTSLVDDGLDFGRNVGDVEVSQKEQMFDGATTNLTIRAQNAWPSATTNQDGGDLILRGGASATGGGTDGSVSLQNPEGINVVNVPGLTTGGTFFELGNGSLHTGTLGSSGSHLVFKTGWGDANVSFWGALMSIAGSGFLRLYLEGDLLIKDSESLSWGGRNGVTSLEVWRDGSDILALRRGTNAQEFRIYGTYTDDSNYERLALKHLGTGDAVIGAERAGTGTSGDLLIYGPGGATNNSHLIVRHSAGNSQIHMAFNGDERVSLMQVLNRLHVAAGQGASQTTVAEFSGFTSGGAGDRPIRFQAGRRSDALMPSIYAHDETADVIAADLVVAGAAAFASATTNQDGGDLILRGGASATGGGTDGSVVVQSADGLTALATFSDTGWAIPETDNFRIGYVGGSNAYIQFLNETGGTPLDAIKLLASNMVVVQGTELRVQGTIPIGWEDGGTVEAGTLDTRLYRDGAADTIAMRRDTNAQTFRVYGTYTDASNYERLSMGYDGTYFTIEVQEAGTGSPQPLRLASPFNGQGTGIVIDAGGTQDWCFSRNGSGGLVSGSSQVSSNDVVLSTLAAGQRMVVAGHSKTSGSGGQPSVHIVGGDHQSAADNAGDVVLIPGVHLGTPTTGRDGLVIIENLPTSDPGVSGAIWNDSGTLKVSP